MKRLAEFLLNQADFLQQPVDAIIAASDDIRFALCSETNGSELSSLQSHTQNGSRTIGDIASNRKRQRRARVPTKGIQSSAAPRHVEQAGFHQNHLTQIQARGISIVLATFVALLVIGPMKAEERAAWMRPAHFGVMTHFLADWRARTDGEPASIEHWNELIDHFDVEGLAQQLQAVGAGWYLITLGQNSGYYLSPNATYDELTEISPSKCSRRDLVADLYEPLHRRGIKLMVYLPAGAPGEDRTAREALEFQHGPNRNKEFQEHWQAIIRQWSSRWGDKVSGWWFDGCYWPNAMYRSSEPPNFSSFAAAARAGNPNSALAFNPGVIGRLISVCPEEDYTAGEVNEPDKILIRRVDSGKIDGAVPHVLSFLGARWGMGNPRFTTEQAVTDSRRIVDLGGVITWDAPIQKTGLISQAFIDQLTAVGKELRKK